jgi:two-component system KDP operon response regulator KdpE
MIGAGIAIVVEDDPQIRGFVTAALTGEGWRVHEVDTVARGIVETGSRKPDLILLDLGLPDGDGVELIRSVRQWSGLPIIVLSARSSERDKVEALDAGADDYLVKPFGVAELLARVRASRRRIRSADTLDQIVRFGHVTVDLQSRDVQRAGQPVHLTPVEYRLLAYLANHLGRVCTHRQLLREVWGPSHADSPQYLRVFMGHLRRKLESDPAQPEHILTETGIGYRLRA